MQLENALLSFLLQQRDLITEHRPLRLRLSHPTQMLEDVLLPQRVYGTESICGGIEYRILCVALDAYLPLKELIALPVAIDFVTDRGDLRSVCGIVTEAAAGDSDGGLASYQLVLRDALAILEKRTNTRVFRNKNEVEIVKLILDEWRQSNSILGTCFDYETDELFEQREYPQREFTMQYNESDAAFIRRLLKRRGIAWYFRADGEASPAHKLVMFNNAESIQPNAAGVVRYHRDNATEERDSITAWCAVRTLQPGSVTRHSWDYMNPQGRDFMTTTATSGVDQGSSGNEMSASLEDYLVQAPHIGDDHDDLCKLGQLAMSRHDYESKCFHGEGSVRDLCAGEYFTLAEHPEIDMHGDGDRDFVVTSLQVVALNNLPKALAERVESLFGRNRWKFGLAAAIVHASQGSLRTKIQFTAVRRGIEIVPAWDPRTELPRAQLHSTIVVGPEGEEVHCDELGRVKIRFPGAREIDHEHAQGAGASDTDSDSAWVRVATTWAGNGPGSQNQCGFLGLPRVGGEVLVAFVDGDPDKPIIVGQLYNQQGAPPGMSSAGQLPGNRHLSGFRSREINAARANQLTFDDTESEISARLASDHANTQLNLGFLTHQRSEGTGAARGEGAELSTDAYIALRAARGLLISAYGSVTAGKQLDREEFLQLLKDCEELSKSLGDLGAKYRGPASNGRPLTSLRSIFQNWEQDEGRSSVDACGEAVIGVTSPGGISLASSGTLASYTRENIEQVAQKSVEFTAAQSCLLNAGKGISLFTQSEGIRQIAQNGHVLIQSQHGATDINAAKELTLTASEGKLIGMAKEIVLVAEDGSFIKLGGGVTIGSQSAIDYHGSKHQFKGGRILSAELPKFGGGDTNLAVGKAYTAKERAKRAQAKSIQKQQKKRRPLGDRDVKEPNDADAKLLREAEMARIGKQASEARFREKVPLRVEITGVGPAAAVASYGGENITPAMPNIENSDLTSDAREMSYSDQMKHVGQFFGDLATGAAKGLDNVIPETAALAYRMTGYAAAGVVSLADTDASDYMFAKYEKVTGRLYDYDNNVQAFGAAAVQIATPGVMKGATVVGARMYELEQGVSAAAIAPLRTVGTAIDPMAAALPDPARLAYRPSSGVLLEASSGRTTTILGNYRQDMKYIVEELGNIKSVDFGARVDGFNVLNVPDELYKTPSQFWTEYNEPWLNNAVVRSDPVLMATEPQFGSESVLFRTNQASGKIELSGFGKEYSFLRRSGYIYESLTKQMVPKP